MLMLASGNLWKPADGKPVTVPTQDIGAGQLLPHHGERGATRARAKVFRDENEAIMAYRAALSPCRRPLRCAARWR